LAHLKQYKQWGKPWQKFDRIIGQICLRKKNVAYVKDEGSNFTTMTIALKFVIIVNLLG
jgi:hypothetical protein